MSEYVPLTDEQLRAELAPTAEQLFDRHLDKAKEWFPHELVPWSDGTDYEEGEEFDPTQAKITPDLRDALRLNLLTEDALPHYFKLLSDQYGTDDVWGEWSRRWTAEEGRHAIVIRDYLAVKKSVDMRQLERERMLQVSRGVVPHPPNVAEGITYVAMQELATRISHRNTGKLLNDPVGVVIMNRVAADENLHHLFYRDLLVSALEIDPSGIVEALSRQVRSFNMPGTGIDDYQELKKKMSLIGMFGTTEYLEDIVIPVVVQRCKVQELDNLAPAAEKARDKLFKGIATLGQLVTKEQEAREAYQNSIAA